MGPGCRAALTLPRVSQMSGLDPLRSDSDAHPMAAGPASRAPPEPQWARSPPQPSGALPPLRSSHPAARNPFYNPLWPRAGAAKRRRSPWRPSPAARRLRRALAAAAETISARRPARSQPRPAPAPNSPPPPLSFRRRSAAPAPLRSPRARADSANCPPPGGFAPLGQPRRGDPAEASLASSFDVRPPSAQRARTPSRPCHARCVRCALPSCSAALQDGC